MNKNLTILALASLMTVSAQAKVRLPHIICDNMVLQQQTEDGPNLARPLR